MSSFLLVHGAWHGGWSWRRVRQALKRRGHRVLTPTMTGVGERRHLLSANLTLDTMVQDIANVLRFEDLADVVLVGHSFAGPVISGVAEELRARIRQLIYLDAALLEDGESMFDCMPPEVAAERRRLAAESDGGLSLPVPTRRDLGILDDEHWDCLARHLTPHPLSTYKSPLSLKRPPGEGLPCSYIVCTDPLYPPLAWSRKRAERYGWPLHTIETGHDAMVSAPEPLSTLLMRLSES